ncbi:Prefoldin subunit 6 [Geodia barretti]|uniref:Prefoldin subunit 6 n=1 Tax=Geodia barretti TaxID=519541 RepID=A0AA35WQF2_GEOBA|nr:Prefoldin subunit 6 [Geodia barretti]
MSNKAAVQALQAKEKVMQDEIERFKKLQKELQKFTASRMQLDTQVNENKTVKEELDRLEEGAVLYKLVGPVLVKQELSEAKLTVEKRLTYITKESERYADMIKETQRTIEQGTEKLGRLQQDYQQALMKVSSAGR